MKARDSLHFALAALRGFRLRSALMMLAMAIGVGAVVLLTALGEAARGYVAGEFASLGTNLVIVIPGRSETSGAGLALMSGATPRDLTLDDAVALAQSELIRRMAPIVLGSAAVSTGALERESVILGSSASMLVLRRWEMAQGRFLPEMDLDRASAVCVIGATIARELFPGQSAVGQWLRIGDRRFRVAGVLASEGRSIGVDVAEVVMVPVASAQQMFNTQGVFRVMLEAGSHGQLESVKRHVRDTIRKRHHGEEDVTVITQDAVLATFDTILRALTFTVVGIAAISLAVAGILVMNVMLVAVAQRTAEIGLLKALGASQHMLTVLFLTEAALLSLLGAGVGLVLGWGGTWLLGTLFPVLPMRAPIWAVLAALGVAVGTGLLFGWLPARRAAALDPVLALARR